MGSFCFSRVFSESLFASFCAIFALYITRAFFYFSGTSVLRLSASLLHIIYIYTIYLDIVYTILFASSVLLFLS